MPNNGRRSYARRRETRIIGRFSHGVLQPYGMTKGMNPRTWRFSIDWRLNDLPRLRDVTHNSTGI
jgi:hypothetical protein